MKAKLTLTYISRLKAKSKPYEVDDTEVPGLFVRVQPSGYKAFYVTWGRGLRKVIGRVGIQTVEQMRIKARNALNEAAESGTPRVALEKRADTVKAFYAEVYKPWAEAGGLKVAKGELKALETEFGTWFKRPLNGFSDLDYKRYRKAKLASGAKVATVNRHLDRFHHLLSRAVEEKHLAAHPWKGRKRNKRKEDQRLRWLKPEEESRLRKALAERDEKMRRERASANKWRAARGYELYPDLGEYGDHLTPMVLVSMNTGLRRGELRQIRWSDADFDHSDLHVRAAYAKSHKGRHIPLNSEALVALDRWKRQSSGDLVFGVARVDRAWKAVLNRAEITNFRWHDLRHHFASRLVQEGADLNVVRDLLGHADLSMTLRYAHLSPGQRSAAVAKLVA